MISHGRMPAPATEAILRQYRIPYALGPVEAELLTPTGAAILATLTPIFLSRESSTPAGICVGAGLGQRDFYRAHSNALRLNLS